MPLFFMTDDEDWAALPLLLDEIEDDPFGLKRARDVEEDLLMSVKRPRYRRCCYTCQAPLSTSSQAITDGRRLFCSWAHGLASFF
jgi:hypothetical protein